MEFNPIKISNGELYHGDCLEVMKGLPDGSVDMVLTSPPYDNLRTYGDKFKGWGPHIWQPVLKHIARLLKPGGICVWVVGDATIKGSETGTSFRQALYAKYECGLNLHDTMIFEQDSFQKPNHNRYWSCFEYMFIFSNGKPFVSNMIKDRPNSQAGKTVSAKTIRNTDGTTSKRKPCVIAEYGKRKNVWSFSTGFMKGTTDRIAYQHPAIFPEKLAHDHIISWSNKDDTILDCFAGSGTTLKMAERLNRKWIGIEQEEKYIDITINRLAAETQQYKLFGN